MKNKWVKEIIEVRLNHDQTIDIETIKGDGLLAMRTYQAFIKCGYISPKAKKKT